MQADPVLGKRGKNERQAMLFEIHDDQGKVVLPAMYVLINPKTYSIKGNQIINRYPTRGAFIEEVWGQGLDEITCSGTTAAFVSQRGLIAAKPNNCSGAKDSRGIEDTEAYQNLESLIAVYRNNGEAYFSDGQIIKLGSVVVIFDGGFYSGTFVQFNLVEDAEKPFSFDFDFIFKVTRTIMAVTT